MKIEEVFARRRFIMLDGAMGTQLQLRGLTTEQKPELAAFIMPDVLTAVHRDYARAGADILLFGNQIIDLRKEGLDIAIRYCPQASQPAGPSGCLAKPSSRWRTPAWGCARWTRPNGWPKPLCWSLKATLRPAGNGFAG